MINYSLYSDVKITIILESGYRELQRITNGTICWNYKKYVPKIDNLLRI